ncbi:hypothetical protein C8J57DRAFT_1250014 [Mycena rebaudengoi]|nr:hypothetical protein C8J57DRAFT_1250014 [Mycena rebaudengoi]
MNQLRICSSSRGGTAQNHFSESTPSIARMMCAYNAEMGQTGAGIQNAAQIDMSITNSFMTKWVVAEIADSAPWFFDMRDLIAERPNLVPTGLGHSSTEIAEGVLMPPAPPPPYSTGEEGGDEGNDDDQGTGTPIEWEVTPAHTPEPESHKCSFSKFAEDPASDDNYREGEGEGEGKGTGKGTAICKGKEIPPSPVHPLQQPQHQLPLDPPRRPSLQKEIELATIRARQALKVVEVKAWLGEQREDRGRQAQQAKQEERHMKLKMKELKLRQAHELHMAAQRAGPSHAASSASSFFDGHSSSGSHYAPSEPSDFTQFDAFPVNAAAGLTASSSMDFSHMDQFANTLGNGFPSA